jgi:CO/xanthine dehydrogenase Mo-binding subunit
VIRIARSEMGQGSLTGLAQLVAEELECDWARVTTEYPTPGANLARNRVWGNFSTGGSRGIRESQDYVRKGGATARDDARAGRGRRVEGAGDGMHGRQRRHHARAERPQDQLRQGRGGRGEAHPARRRAAEGPEDLEGRGQAGASASTPRPS